jgi:hypothetical protein
MASVFVKTTAPDLFISPRSYPKGSVVEVDEARAKTLIDDKVAVPSDGPASEPTRVTPELDKGPKK